MTARKNVKNEKLCGKSTPGLGDSSCRGHKGGMSRSPGNLSTRQFWWQHSLSYFFLHAPPHPPPPPPPLFPTAPLSFREFEGESTARLHVWWNVSKQALWWLWTLSPGGAHAPPAALTLPKRFSGLSGTWVQRTKWQDSLRINHNERETQAEQYY